jgi:parvulin-like peptidyl-prolyl isomerase
MTLQSLQKPTGQELSVLMTVNSDPFELRESLRRFIFNNKDIFIDESIDELLVRQYAAQNNINNTTEELQVAADELRYQKSLESVEKFQHWLRDSHQTILSVQNHLDYQLLRHKIQVNMSQQEVEAYFAEHQLDLDRADLYSIRVCNQQTAEELYAKITDEGENFHLLAMEHSLDEESKPKGGYIGKLRRDEVSAGIEAAVFGSQPGNVIGPIETEKGYNLFKVGAVYPASLEAEQENIRELLFVELMIKLRATAEITYPIFEDL